MKRVELVAQIRAKQSYLCVGLDPDLSRFPHHLLELEEPIFEFNKQIIDATQDLCVAYKPNLAFYESLGIKGLSALQKTLDYIPKTHFTIADAKRGDIGNTSRMYASAFFEQMEFDSITIAPYMGADSVQPFLEFEDKWVILLGLTSNKGSQDFQFLEADGKPIYEHVLRTASTWGTPENLMFVVGATHPKQFQDIRAIVPDSFLLVPGIGAQGGDLAAVSQYGMNQDCGLLVNSSRGILYAGEGEDFAKHARAAALEIQQQMVKLLKEYTS